MRLTSLSAALVAAAMLSACSVPQVAGTAGPPTAQKGAPSLAKEAVQFWGIAKGIAQVAVAADPAVAPAVNVIIAVGDGLAAAVRPFLAADTVSAAAAGEVDKLSGMAQQLLVLTAGNITAVPNK